MRTKVTKGIYFLEEVKLILDEILEPFLIC
jgi:hypothetical protein